MLFSAQSFSSCPISALCTEIQLSYNGEFLGFTINIARNRSDILSVQRDVSFDLIVT